MKIALIVVAVLFLAIIRLCRSLSRRYKPFFTDEHYQELCELAEGLKQGAIERMGRPFETPVDPRGAQTTKGVRMIYSIDHEGALYLHHLSFSYGGTPIAFAAGGRFLYVMLRSLGILDRLKSVAHSRNGITHGLAVLAEDQQRRFVESGLDVPGDREMPELKLGATAWHAGIIRSGQLARSEDELYDRAGFALATSP